MKALLFIPFSSPPCKREGPFRLKPDDQCAYLPLLTVRELTKALCRLAV